jgi:purine nucleosidase/non-specific riboncleoside hydrolase
LLFIDPLAAAVVVAPDIVTGQLRASVATVLDYGIARGMTLIDPAGRVGTPVASVVESVDIARLKTFYLSSLGGYRP